MSVACVDLPALPLQLLWRQHPAWRDKPVVVVAEDRPQGEVLWACDRARALRILPGQRYAHALSSCAELRAQVVEPEEISAAVSELSLALGRVAPRIEPVGERSARARLAAGAGAPEQAGTFWLDGEGLGRLFPSQERWATAIREAVVGCGLTASVVVGASRFATYAIARSLPASRTTSLVFSDPEEEQRAAYEVSLSRLDLEPRFRDALARLGIHSLGQLVQLPSVGILERFGVEACRLVQLARGERWDPLVPSTQPERLEQRVLLDDEERALEPLVFVIKSALDRLLSELAARRRALTELHLELRLRHSVHVLETRTEHIKPAEPTLDSRSLLRLVHLRLEGTPPRAGVIELRLWSSDEPATSEQLSLFRQKPTRDPRAAREVLARLRAELGEDAVTTPGLRDGHLPEASFGWQRLSALVDAQPQTRRVSALIRRIFSRAQALPQQSSSVRDDGWMLSGLEHGAVVRIQGPYVLSGGWWIQELHREYHFVETKRGDCLWLYYDQGRRRWFWHGAVE